MKQAKLLLLTLLAVLGYSGARADTVENDYIVDFNTAISTSKPITIARNWSHIVGTANYSYAATDGVDNSGSLLVYSQGSATDVLVTPRVSGTVSIQVKRSISSSSSNHAYVEFYAVDDNGATVGDLLAERTDLGYYGDGGSGDWQTVTVTLSDYGRIGIKGQYVYFDNFTASSANIIDEAKLKIKTAVPSDVNGTIYWNQQPNGKVLVSYSVTVENTGDVELVSGNAGYSVTIVNDYTSDDVVTVDVPYTLAPGETSEAFVVSAEVETSLWPNSYTYIPFNLRENITNTTVERAQSRYVAYEPKFAFREAGSTSTSSISNAAWGTITESTTKNYEIYNDGTAPLIVNSIAMPEGFTTTALDGTTSVKLIHSGFDDAGAVFYAWTWADGEGRWVSGNNDVYEGLDNNVIFVRMNPNGAPSWGDAKWNQTGNLTLQGGGYVLDSYNGDEMVGHWVAAVVDAKASKAIDITQDAATQGTFSGNVTVKYLNASSTEVTYELPISTTVIGANTWFAEFPATSSTAVTFPEGSVAEAGVRQGVTYVSAGNYEGYLYSYNSSSYANANNKFITPLLHANAGDQLTFDVARDESGSNYNLKVYVSKDRVNWGEPVYTVTSADLTSAWQKQSITFDEEGDYYVAFAIYGVKIDNIVGLEKVNVAFDLYIKELNAPDATIKSGASQSKPTVDVIPLTTVSASEYTVQLVCGDQVLAEATPVDMTASATSSSSKKFTFNWTPEVETTTTFENAKVVFTFNFADGEHQSVIETEPFTFTVTNEPKFHFLNSIPSSKWYEPTDRSEAITFPKTNDAEASQTFYIYNWGSAPLTVKSVSLPEGFSTPLETPATVAAFDESDLNVAAQALVINFSTTTPGTYSGDMVITYVDGTGADATFTLPVSGTKLDLNKWYANFDDGNWPAGSTYQSNVSKANATSYGTANYYISSSSTTNNLFITPKLTAEAGETITFDAKLYSTYNNSGQVKVYAAATRDELTDTEVEKTPIFTTEGMTTDFQTFTVTIPEAGDYYLGFEISGRPYVDEFYGLTPAETGLDLTLVSQNIPTQGMQNVPLTATLNINNFGAEEVAGEDYFVSVILGDLKTTTEAGTVALPMTPLLSATGTQVPVQIQSPKAGTYPVTIALTDTEGNVLVETETVDVEFAEEVAVSGVQVGNKSTTSSNVPFYTTWMDDSSGKAMADIIYTPQQLAAFGIVEGSVIKSITYTGTISSYGGKTINSLTTEAWVAQQDATTFTAGSVNKDDMTHVVLHNAEAVTFTASSNVEFKIDLSDEPIIYDGTSGIRIYTNINGNGQYTSISFDIDNNYKNAYYGRGNSPSWSNSGNPVAFFELAVESASIAGTVTDADNQPIANATVTLVSSDGDDVQYEANTDAEGNYIVNVIQSQRNYTATASAAGYEDATAEVSFADGNVTQNFTLTAMPDFVEVTIGEHGAASFSSKYALDFTGSDVYAYIITGRDGSIFTKERVYEVPANTGIIVAAAAGTYQVAVDKANDAEEIEGNMLEATSTGEYEVSEEDYGTIYGLFYSSKQKKVGFQKKKAGYVFGKDKSFLRLPAGANASEIFFDFTATGIDTIAVGDDMNGDTYNLNGQKVNRSYRGVIIRNGRKIIQK